MYAALSTSRLRHAAVRPTRRASRCLARGKSMVLSKLAAEQEKEAAAETAGGECSFTDLGPDVVAGAASAARAAPAAAAAAAGPHRTSHYSRIVEPAAPGVAAAAAAAAGPPLAAAACPSLELLEELASRLHIPPANFEGGFTMPLAARHQGRQNRCVASAFATAVSIRALFQANGRGPLFALRSAELRPSVAHAYHAQRVLECQARDNPRCDCGPVCGGECEDCGSIPRFMCEAFAQGIVMERQWPVRYACKAHKRMIVDTETRNAHNARVTELVEGSQTPSSFVGSMPHYRLKHFEFLPLGRGVAAMAFRIQGHMAFGSPVVACLLQYQNQLDFFARMKEIQGSLPTDATVYDAAFTLPPPTGTPLSMAHAVTIVGMNPALKKLRLRNSRGEHWGFHGDFSMETSQLGRHQVVALIAVLEVELRNGHLVK